MVCGDGTPPGAARVSRRSRSRRSSVVIARICWSVRLTFCIVTYADNGGLRTAGCSDGQGRTADLRPGAGGPPGDRRMGGVLQARVAAVPGRGGRDGLRRVRDEPAPDPDRCVV